MKIGLYINKSKQKLPLALDIIFKLFSTDNNEIIFLNELNFIEKKYKIKVTRPNDAIKINYDVLVAVGGDGTIMSAIRSQFHLNKLYFL